MDDGSSGSGAPSDLEDRLQDADAAIEALAQKFEVWAGEKLLDAKQALKTARAKSKDRQPQIQEIFIIVHDMKGQGGTFGFELITLIGRSLCEFIRQVPDATDLELKAIDQHLAIMTMVFDNQIKGSGGQFAEKIKAKLENIISAALESTVS